MATNTSPSCSPTSWTCTTLGWESLPSARASRRSRARAPLGAARGVQELERDAPVELRIVGGVDLAHAAAADQREDQVAADRRPSRQGSAARRIGPRRRRTSPAWSRHDRVRAPAGHRPPPISYALSLLRCEPGDERGAHGAPGDVGLRAGRAKARRAFPRRAPPNLHPVGTSSMDGGGPFWGEARAEARPQRETRRRAESRCLTTFRTGRCACFKPGASLRFAEPVVAAGRGARAVGVAPCSSCRWWCRWRRCSK